jgi:BBSome-interacting protein 1
LFYFFHFFLSENPEHSVAALIHEILPKQGLVFSEKGGLPEVLSKPKLLPIKSLTLEKLEALQKEAQEKAKSGFRPFKVFFFLPLFFFSEQAPYCCNPLS